MRVNNCTFTCSRSWSLAQLPSSHCQNHSFPSYACWDIPLSHSLGEKEQELEQRYAQTRTPGRSVLLRTSKEQTCFHFSPGWDKAEGTSFACMPDITELLGS